MRNLSLQLPLYACLLLIAACEKNAEVVVYDDKALADETQTANWLAYGRTHNERRFSPSDQINTGNVADLKVERHNLKWLKYPDYAQTGPESPVHNERCTPGSGTGGGETGGSNPDTAPCPHVHLKSGRRRT